MFPNETEVVILHAGMISCFNALTLDLDVWGTLCNYISSAYKEYYRIKIMELLLVYIIQ